MAQTYKFGNGTWATKKGSTLAYSDTNNAFKPLPFSFERNSIATRVNKEGLIEVVGNDIPRIDYTDSTEGALLLENSSTNLLPYSEDFSNAYWSNVRSIISVNSAISPDGTQNSDELQQDAITTNAGVFFKQFAFTATTYTYSVFAKFKEVKWIALAEAATSGNVIRTWFDIEDGVIGTINSNHTAKIENYGNDWYRCSITFLATAGSFNILNYLADANGSSTSELSKGSYFYGTQLEQNSFSTSYIPTNGSIIQRAAETCNESGNSEVFNDSQGVLFANVKYLTETAIFNRSITISDNTINNRLQITLLTNGELLVLYGDNSGNQTIQTTNNLTQFNKVALSYDSNSLRFYLNGIEIGNILGDFSSINSLQTLRFDNTISEDFYGKIKELAYYDTALTDAELEYMTSYRSLKEMVTELNLNAL